MKTVPSKNPFSLTLLLTPLTIIIVIIILLLLFVKVPHRKVLEKERYLKVFFKLSYLDYLAWTLLVARDCTAPHRAMCLTAWAWCIGAIGALHIIVGSNENPLFWLVLGLTWVDSVPFGSSRRFATSPDRTTRSA